jgi:hypothetical protein
MSNNIVIFSIIRLGVGDGGGAEQGIGDRKPFPTALATATYVTYMTKQFLLLRKPKPKSQLRQPMSYFAKPRIKNYTSMKIPCHSIRTLEPNGGKVVFWFSYFEFCLTSEFVYLFIFNDKYCVILLSEKCMSFLNFEKNAERIKST